jgi:hypothetical protein
MSDGPCRGGAQKPNIDLAFAFRCLRVTVSVRGTGGSHLAFGSFFVLTGAPRNNQCRTGTEIAPYRCSSGLALTRRVGHSRIDFHRLAC